jgi:hypothetical protein
VVVAAVVGAQGKGMDSGCKSDSKVRDVWTRCRMWGLLRQRLCMKHAMIGSQCRRAHTQAYCWCVAPLLLQLRKDINSWVAKYRRDTKFSGKPSYG